MVEGKMNQYQLKKMVKKDTREKSCYYTYLEWEGNIEFYILTAIGMKEVTTCPWNGAQEVRYSSEKKRGSALG